MHPAPFRHHSHMYINITRIVIKRRILRCFKVQGQWEIGIRSPGPETQPVVTAPLLCDPELFRKAAAPDHNLSFTPGRPLIGSHRKSQIGRHQPAGIDLRNPTTVSFRDFDLKCDIGFYFHLHISSFFAYFEAGGRQCQRIFLLL